MSAGLTWSRRPLPALLVVALALLTLPGLPARAATRTVRVTDNEFEPREIRVDVGDTVVWTNEGRNVHDIRADDDSFRSGDLSTGESFSHTFSREGYFYYFCAYHGAKRKVGMWGLVVVGDPPADADPYKDLQRARDERPVLHVPGDFETIQAAVDAAEPGTKILIDPGRYHEAVVVQTPRLIIQGVDRFRTVIDGKDELNTGFLVDSVNGVKIRNLTVRNFLGNGIYFFQVRDYEAARIDSLFNRVYGIYAFRSYNGVFRDSFGYASGDSAFYVGECMGCGALLDNVHAEANVLGYSGTNATGVVIRNSTFVRNGSGVVPNTLPTEELGPNRGTLIVDNVIRNNNFTGTPAAGFSETLGAVWGTGVWLAGVDNNVVRNNLIVNHDRYGVLLTPSVFTDAVPDNNQVIGNTIRNTGKYALAWEGSGMNNCFSRNRFEGETGPPQMQTLFACENRPFVGILFPPVGIDVVIALTYENQTRAQADPPEPKRPPCQRGAPNCHRR
jgi:plastocyanin